LPENLVVRVSAHRIDAAPPQGFPNTATVIGHAGHARPHLPLAGSEQHLPGLPRVLGSGDQQRRILAALIRGSTTGLEENNCRIHSVQNR